MTIAAIATAARAIARTPARAARALADNATARAALTQAISDSTATFTGRQDDETP